MRIGVIGVTGCGKSTLVKKLSKALNCPMSLEPIPASLKKFLDHLGTPDEHIYRVLHDANIVKAHMRLLEKRNVPDIIMERPAAENYYIFGDGLNQGFMFEAYRALAPKFPLDIVIFLYADVDTILERIHQRARAGEENYTREWVQAHINTYLDNYRLIAGAHGAREIISLDTTGMDRDDVLSYFIHRLR